MYSSQGNAPASLRQGGKHGKHKYRSQVSKKISFIFYPLNYGTAELYGKPHAKERDTAGLGRATGKGMGTATIYNLKIHTMRKDKNGSPIFYNKDGSLTDYALSCGYIERKGEYANGKQWAELYKETIYHVRDYLGRWESFDSLTTARRYFKTVKICEK